MKPKKKTLERRLIKQIRSFLHCWYSTPLGKEKDYQKLAEELYWKAIHQDLSQELKREKEDSYKKGYFKGVLDSEYGQVTSDELLPDNLPKGAIIENVASKLKGKSHKK